jgi:hypothetical protein
MSNLGTTRRDFLAVSGSAVGGSLLGPAVSAPACEPRPAEAEHQQDTKPVVIGLVQMRCGRDPGGNLKKAIGRIAYARSKGAQLVILPELFSTRYFCRAGGKHGSPEAKAAEKAIAAAREKLSVKLDGPEIKALAKPTP